MEPKLYYTKQELYAIPHFNIIETETNLYLHQKNGDFEIYKKLYILKNNAPDVTEIYVELKTYLVVKDYLENSLTRWLNEFNSYVFYSVDDMVKQFDEANKNRLF